MAEPTALPSVVIVTGTGTGVGKTIATAALVAMLRRRGTTVAVVKPVQTGVSEGEAGDLEVIRALAGADDAVTTHELARLRAPLAPDTAARLEGATLPTVADDARAIAALAARCDVVLVEGAGGLLVRLDERGATLADLGAALLYKGVSVGYVVVTSAGLGTLNHTALTAEALASRGLPLLGVLVGSYPSEPGLAERHNLSDLPDVARAPLLGVLPEGAGALAPTAFRAQAPGWLEIS